MVHQAAWIKAKQARLELGQVDTPAPGPGEVLVKVRAIAFNPVESKIQQYEPVPVTYPNILGLSFAGYIEAIGPDVTQFAVGDKVGVNRLNSKYLNPRFGAFQQFALASIDSMAKLEPETALHDGAAVMINLGSVSSALSYYMGLERPKVLEAPPATGKKILVYGGSSSAGGLAIDYARAAGYDVVTTSSPKNRDLVASHGPIAIIDHTQPAEQIVRVVEGHGPYFKILDTIGLPKVTNILTEYLASLGGGSYCAFIPLLGGENPIPDSVKRVFAAFEWSPSEPDQKDITKWFYQELVPKGLASGKIIPTVAQHLPAGLENVQDALDLMARGEVSARKLILDPWHE